METKDDFKKKKRVFLSDLDFFSQKNIGKFAEKQQSPRCLPTSRQEEDAGNDTSARIKACSSPKLTCHFLSLLVTFLNFLNFLPHHVLCACSMLVLFFKNIILNIIMLYYFHSIFDVFLYSLSADLPIL